MSPISEKRDNYYINLYSLMALPLNVYTIADLSEKLAIAPVDTDVGGNVGVLIHPVITEESLWQVNVRRLVVNGVAPHLRKFVFSW